MSQASFTQFTPNRIKIELLSGLTVALALVPEAVAFAFVAGVHPLVGLYAAFIVGLVTAVIGGRPGMISGATGALAVVMVSLVAQHGVEYLFATVVLMGILQLAAGIFRFGKFIRLVPHPVMLGFVNGLAIVIFMAQLTQFQVPGTAEVSAHGMSGGEWMSGWPLAVMLALVGLTMAIIWLLPKFTKIIPAPLAGIGIVAAVVIGFGLDVPRVGDLASIQGGLPSFHMPSVPLTFETFKIILPYAVILAAIGLIESLLTLNLVGEITGKRGGASQECVAQGTANLITGFFGGMGGCAMIGQSMINVKSGGRTRIAGIAAALFLTLPYRKWAVPAGILLVLSTIATAFFGFGPGPALPLAFVNVSEALLTAHLLRKFRPQGDYVTSGPGILALIGIAGFAVPITLSLFGSFIAWRAVGGEWWLHTMAWIVGHGLGAMLVMPLVLLISGYARSDGAPDMSLRLSPRRTVEFIFVLALIAGISTATIFQTGFPLLFLPMVPVVLASYRFGRLGATVGVLVVTVVAA
ncbi:SulP family inorganic anion transporter, partial [uncultured Hyphomonas sp.]|uniref:SulP family inorganic anion transporter n=1 Tax=uncultured Hyphomonas sp. TaxID=225298 RepID=UPI00344B2B49